MLNIKHTLLPFQERDMNSVIKGLNLNRKLCFQAQTSYGKTYSFCTIGKWFNHNYNKKVLILAHSEELVYQALATCVKMGLTVEVIESKTKKLHHRAMVYIAMEKTLHNRLKKNPRFLFEVGLVIIDEAHSQSFLKHIHFFKEQKILGFTATPIINERVTFWKCERCDSEMYTLQNCCGREPMEWSKPKAMSLFYDDIVVGANVDELIEYGQVVRDICFVQNYTDLSKLKVDNKGEFTSDSLNDAYGSEESVFNCLLNYENIALGKKTIIFNPSSKVNKLIYDQFKEKGYNIKLYDSVNDTEDNRKNTVKWFNETEGAILCNVSCFTTGFDSTDIQCVMLNRSTLSLSLFLQMVGRGARASKNIFKDSFIVIDGGGNISRFNKWSDPTRDWKKIFFDGIGKPKIKKENILSVSECRNCGALYAKSEVTCPECGESKPIKIKPESEVSEDILQPIDNIPLPNGKKIAQYTLSKGENIFFAFAILTQQIIDLFMYNAVSKAQYLSNLNDGRLDKRLGEIIRPVYFILIGMEEFKNDANRTLKQVTKIIKEKLGKYYNI